MGKLTTHSKPNNRERYNTYRNGDVETLTFESEDYHLCYGEDSRGEVYDFCFMGTGSVTHVEGKLSDEEIGSAQEIIDNLKI